MKVGVILHGKKHRSREVRKAIDAFQIPGISIETLFTKSPKDSVNIARRLSVEKDLIVGVGGDGTLHECLNGILQFHQQFPDLPIPALALLPFGTGNDYARHFGWRRGDVDQFLERLTEPVFHTIDVGEIIREGCESAYFINAADAGLGAHVVRYVEKMRDYLPAAMLFPVAILRGLITYRRDVIRAKSADLDFQGESLTTVVALGTSFADGIYIAPEGHAHDGQFRVTRIGKISLAQYFRYLPALKKGQKIIHPEVWYFNTSEIELSGPALLEADGEAAGILPARLRVKSGLVKILG